MIVIPFRVSRLHLPGVAFLVSSDLSGLMYRRADLWFDGTLTLTALYGRPTVLASLWQQLPPAGHEPSVIALHGSSRCELSFYVTHGAYTRFTWVSIREVVYSQVTFRGEYLLV